MRKVAAQTAQAAAEAEATKLELARNRLKYTVLRASQSGVVTAVRFEVGQVVAEGQPVVSIANEGEPEIVVDVPEDQLATFQPARYKASLASAPDETFDVALRELVAAGRGADANLPRAAQARHRTQAAARRNRHAHRSSAPRRQAPVAPIPASAITQNNGQPALWIVRRQGTEPAGIVELIRVAVHGYRNDEVLVSGPAAGELVVSAGVQKMAPGLHVTLPAAAQSAALVSAGQVMKSFNLTEWALNHRAIVLFLILVIAVGGSLSFTKLGQLEDPNFSVPSMTAIVLWPGATAQQMQDEVLNRMEKKFEQLDHFDKVKTFARQGFAGMTISVKDGTSKPDQREAWYQVRKKFSDIKLELPEGVVGPIFNDEYGDVYGLLYAVKGDGIGQAELSDLTEDIKRRLLKVPMARKVDVIGKQAKKVYVEFSHQRLAALGITPVHDRREPAQPEQPPPRRLDRHQRRPRTRARQRSVRERGRHPQRAHHGGRPPDQARRLRDRHARVRGSAHVHGSPQRPASADAWHRDDRGRQHRRPRQGDREGSRERSIGASLRGRARARRRSADDGERCGLGVRALAARSARHRPGSEPAEPRLAHGPRRWPVGTARARRRCPGNACDGLEPRACVARIADHRAGIARRRRDHRR